MTQFSGRWSTTYGPMDLTQEGDRVHGTYGGQAFLKGAVQNGRLVFHYQEPDAAGEGWFELARFGKFTGQWRAHGNPHWAGWQGERGFDGIWETTYGPMRLFHHDDRIHGFYEGVGMASLEGRLDGDRFAFHYQEPTAAGEGWFTLADDGLSFRGQWRPQGGARWGDWGGRRVRPVAGLKWLVVLEAHWQKSLAEEEYAFGHMLREFLARVGHVQVRHRFFPNEAGLEKWCRELRYLAEPTVLVIAAHGNDQGLMAQGQPIGPRVLVDTLPWAENLVLLHFSACLMLADGPSGTIARALCDLGRFPVSGYATSVDWAASAILEFTYLDLILARGLVPEAAAEQVPHLLTFAGEPDLVTTVYPGTGFRFWPPKPGGER